MVRSKILLFGKELSIYFNPLPDYKILAWVPAFYLFPTIFPKGLFLRGVKNWHNVMKR